MRQLHTFSLTFLSSRLMDSLLKISSRVEAAVEAYSAVKPVSNLEEWKRHFDDEKVSATL